jgi:5-carboxymethyl-2-hydroxymuconate isomerase
MPVIHFEYTSNLTIEGQVNDFLKEVHAALVKIIKTDLLTCRSTINCHEKYLIGDGASDNAFIHLSIRMLPGRSKEVKDELGNQLLTIQRETFSDEIARHNTQTRVYLTEVDRDYYYGL